MDSLKTYQFPRLFRLLGLGRMVTDGVQDPSRSASRTDGDAPLDAFFGWKITQHFHEKTWMITG